MRRKQAEIDPAEAHAARLAWWAAFVTTAVLALGIGFVHTAEAATPAAPPPQQPISSLLVPEGEEEEEEAEEAEGEEEEFEGEECEAGEFEEWGEEEELECVELEEAEGDESTPAACRLESADGAVSADLAHRKLRLALRYTAHAATAVKIKYSLRGSRGPLTLPVERSRLRRGGVFRTARKLNRSQAKKVAAARTFVIRVSPAGAPGYCHGYLDQRLTIRRGGKPGPTWIDTDSTFRRARRA